MSSPIVLDASAAVRMALKQASPNVVDAVSNADVIASAPFFAFEVTNAFWKYVRARLLNTDLAKAAVAETLALVNDDPIGRLGASTSALAEEAFAEACRLDHPVYDLVYAVLARRLSAPLVTCDGRLASVADTLGIEVIGCQKDEA